MSGDAFDLLYLILIGVGIIVCIAGFVISLKLRKRGPSHASIRRMSAMTTSQEFEEFSGGECWVHWEFSPEAWAAEAKRVQDREEKTANAPSQWLVVPCCTALFGILFGFPWGFLRAAELTGIAFALGLPLVWVFRRMPLMRYRRALRCPPEVYLGSKGMYFKRKFTPWRSELLGLKSVDLLAGPPQELHLIMQRIRPGRYGSTRSDFAIFLPILAGCEEQAPALAGRLKSQAG